MDKDYSSTKENKKLEPAMQDLHRHEEKEEFIHSEKMRYKNADEIYE